MRLTLAILGMNWQASFFEHAAPAPCWPAYGRLPALHMFSYTLSDHAHMYIHSPLTRSFLNECGVVCRRRYDLSRIIRIAEELQRRAISMLPWNSSRYVGLG
jgi:hypothetical protein